jgi:nicotinamide phosphoribosyltransferase
MQLWEGTTRVYSNLTPRKSRIEGVNHVIFFGLQYFIKKYLIEEWNNNFFKKSFDEVGPEYQRMMDATLGAGTVKLKHIKELHDLGYLPLKIKALPEGSLVPIRVPLLTIVNTVDSAFWLTNYLETILSCSTWQPITSATIAFEFRKLIDKFSKLTNGNTDFCEWIGHDFSFRGMSSLESACMSGAGHLISFTGSDTVPANHFIEKYYNGNVNELISGSVPASEHSVMCFGELEGEINTFNNLLDKFPTGILSVVSDTWSLPNVLVKILPNLKDKILNRPGKLVIRPDSFWTDPVDCICGFEGFHPQMSKLNNDEIQVIKKGLIESLWDIFGGTVNNQGFKVLNPCIGAIYGDSISIERATKISQRLMDKGFVSTSCVFGIGSYTYQFNTRDTFGLAVKATYGIVNGVSKEIFKDPVTDDGMKKSAKGLLRVDMVNGHYTLRDCVTPTEEEGGELKTVFLDGKLIKDWKFSEIRETAAAWRS